jgi:hypothetical protein
VRLEDRHAHDAGDVKVVRARLATTARPLALACLVAFTSGAAAAPIARVPFKWTPGQIEVAVLVNGTPATFLLDTGAEYSVVSSRLAERLNLTVEQRGSSQFAGDVTLAVGDVVLRHPRVLVMPFDSYYARGRTIEGLVGYDFFARYVVTIDFKGTNLQIWEPSVFAPPKGAVSVPIEFAGRLPVMRSVLTLETGKSLDVRLMVDTGASQAVILRYPFTHAHGLFDLGGPASTAPSLASGVRQLTEIPVRQIRMAKWTFPRPRVRAFAEPVGSGGSTASDGLIGNDLLARFTLSVDYSRKRLLLQ